MISTRSRATVVFVIALMLGGQAAAQQNGNTYNGVHNQPSKGPVRAKESQAGVAPPPTVQRQQTHETDRLYNQLMKQEGVHGPAATATGTVPSTPSAPVR